MPKAFFLSAKINTFEKAVFNKLVTPGYSCVDFSSFLTLRKTITAEAIHAAAKIPHNTDKSTLSHKKLPTTTNLLPTAVVNSQPPCISPINRFGAILEMKEAPIGLKNISATVRTK